MMLPKLAAVLAVLAVARAQVCVRAALAPFDLKCRARGDVSQLLIYTEPVNPLCA